MTGSGSRIITVMRARVLGMATYQSGGVRRSTPNSRTAASSSAKKRQCPRCQRKSALVFISEDVHFGFACRWPDCGYANLTER